MAPSVALAALALVTGVAIFKDDIDQILIDWLADEFLKDERVDLRKDPMALQRLTPNGGAYSPCRCTR